MINISTDVESSRAIDSIVLGFSADPILRWLYPEPQKYLTNFPTIVQLYGGGAFEHSSAYQIQNYAGAALWLPPDVHPDEERRVIDIIHQTNKELPDLITIRWGLVFNVPLLLEAKIGPNWLDTKDVS